MIRKSITNMFAFCILAIPIISSADDIELLVDKSMGQKALNAVDFPLEVRFPLNRASLSEETYSLGEADIGDIEFLSPGQDINLVESSDLSEAFEKAILSTVKSYRDGSLNIKDLESDERKAIELISKAIPSDQPTDIAILQGKDGDVKKALELLITKKRIKFEVLWVRFKVVNRPNLKLSNPIELSGLSTRTKAKAQACVRAFGKWWCAKATTPWIRIDGRYVYLDMSSSGAVVKAMPRFKDPDIVITIKVFKWRIKIPIGITSMVNREVRKKGPIELIDLSPFEQEIPYSNKKAKIDRITINGDPKGLLIKSDMKVE